MKKGLFAIVACLLIISSANADSWEVSLDANLTATLNTYSDSWTGDETGSFSWASQIVLLLNKQLIKKFRTENTLKVGFGQSKMQDKKSNKWSELQISTDIIDFETIGKFTLGAFLDPYISGRVQTQFLNGIPENIKVKYVNPLVITESFGGSRDFIKKDNHSLSVRFGGAIYQRVNRKVDNTNDGGLELVTKYAKSTKNNTVSYTMFLNLYQALFSSEKAVTSTYKTIDIDWQNNLTMNITKYVMVNFMYQLLYDRDISEKARSRQVLSLGLTFKYKNEKDSNDSKGD